MGRGLRRIEPRLLTKPQAAAYAGLGAPLFAKVCPVVPCRVAPGIQGLRYDRFDLDNWLDSLPKGGDNARPKDWLRLVGNDENQDARPKALRQQR